MRDLGDFRREEQGKFFYDEGQAVHCQGIGQEMECIGYVSGTSLGHGLADIVWQTCVAGDCTCVL